jgi:hypothetical protein
VNFFFREPQIRQIGDVSDLFFCEIQAVALLRESRYTFFNTAS